MTEVKAPESWTEVNTFIMEKVNELVDKRMAEKCHSCTELQKSELSYKTKHLVVYVTALICLTAICGLMLYMKMPNEYIGANVLIIGAIAGVGLQNGKKNMLYERLMGK